MSTTGRFRALVAGTRAVALRPSLWPTAVVQARRFAPDGWWRRWPFVPLPAPELLAFRATTQYGDPHHPLEPGDVIIWLCWCRSERRRRHR